MQIQIDSPILYVVLMAFIILYLVNPYRKAKGSVATVNKGQFLDELITGYNYWMDKGEKEYADAYQVLINKFSEVEEAPEQ
jgi:hypothetical protein